MDESALLWTAFLGVVSLGTSVVVGIIGWFLKGTIAKSEQTAQDLERVKGELRSKVAVLEERVNGVSRLDTTLASMKAELLLQLHQFREEVKSEMGEFRQDLRTLHGKRSTP